MVEPKILRLELDLIQLLLLLLGEAKPKYQEVLVRLD